MGIIISVISKIIFFPEGILTQTSLLHRILAIIFLLIIFFMSKKNIIISLLASTMFFILINNIDNNLFNF